MPNASTNLLPPSRQSQLAREYRFRLGVVAISMMTALILVAAVLLVPTFVFLAGSVNAKQAHLTSIKSTLSSSSESSLSARLAALSDATTVLIALSNEPSSSAMVSAALAIPRPGVTLSGFAYTHGTGKNHSTLALSGVAATRNALRNYQLALQGAPFALSANLPVSAYAKYAEINFTILITLAP